MQVGLIRIEEYPEQSYKSYKSYKSCIGILGMESKIGKERLDNTCKRALDYDAISYNSTK